MRVLVTGANGFVGKRLVEALSEHNIQTVAAARRELNLKLPGVSCVRVKELSAQTDWFEALNGVDVVMHTAARAHITKEIAIDPTPLFHKANVDGLIALANQAIQAKVKRFVFISSIGVNGSETKDKPFCEDDVPNPQLPYAISKFDAEKALQVITAQSEMTYTIIRPPLVYGPGARGNLERLRKLIAGGLPLPFGAINNARSMISRENLVDILIQCSDNPAAANEIFVVADGVDVTTTQILQNIARSLNKRARLLPVPIFLLKVLLKSLGQGRLAGQLFGSLQVNNSKIKAQLNWQPKVSPHTDTWA